MTRLNNLHSNLYVWYVWKPDDAPLERVSAYKVLGANITEDFSWNVHTTKSIRSAYRSHESLTQLKRFTPYQMKKSLAEAVVARSIRF